MPAWSADTMAATLDTSLENVFPDDPGTHGGDRSGPCRQWKSAGGGGAWQPKARATTSTTWRPTRLTLRDHVAEQIAFSVFRRRCLIAQYLADELDEAGYLRTVRDVAERLGVRPKRSNVLLVMPDIRSRGTVRRRPRERLSAAARQRDRLDPAMALLPANLDLLARRDFQALQRLCGVDQEDLLDMLREIRALDRRLGSAFSGPHPDRGGRGGSPRERWQLGGRTHPRDPAARPRRRDLLHPGGPDRPAIRGEGLLLGRQSANWLTRSLDQRARTIIKVASEIVRQQDAFLMHGIRHRGRSTCAPWPRRSACTNPR